MTIACYNVLLLHIFFCNDLFNDGDSHDGTHLLACACSSFTRKDNLFGAIVELSRCLLNKHQILFLKHLRIRNAEASLILVKFKFVKFVKFKFRIS